MHRPWLDSCSMISCVRRALVSLAQLELSRISLASRAPSVVDGQVCFSTAAVLFVPRWCEALVFVTSWNKPVSAERLPEP